ncbi:hypothetical protein INT45_001811 [Circinella minor]|uniref:CCHC-type domain-containing protein n=1 Tax=Circinella minor TaxID=1195481 RepID=A0A8H7VDJ8_9FUNG|nr:hypothetical protein INT45_001811 [Circinella minor]
MPPTKLLEGITTSLNIYGHVLDCGIYRDATSGIFMGNGFAVLDRQVIEGAQPFSAMSHNISWLTTDNYFYATWASMPLHCARCHKPDHHVRICPSHPCNFRTCWTCGKVGHISVNCTDERDHLPGNKGNNGSKRRRIRTSNIGFSTPATSGTSNTVPPEPIAHTSAGDTTNKTPPITQEAPTLTNNDDSDDSDDEEMINVTQELDNDTSITPSPVVTIDNVAVTLSTTFAEKATNPSAFSNIIQQAASQQINTNWHTHYPLSTEDRSHLLGLPEAEQKVAAMMLRLRFPHQEKIDPTPDQRTTKNGCITRSSQQTNNKQEPSGSALDSLQKTHNSEARSSLIRYLRQQQPQLLALQEINANTNDISQLFNLQFQPSATTSSLRERHQFFEYLQSSLIFTNTTLPYTDRLIIAGDFNYNCYSTEHHNHISTSWCAMLNTNFIDCINDTMAQPPLPTYRHGDTYFSTLDFIFASRSLRPLISRATVQNICKAWSDHSILSSFINMGDSPRGKSYWRGNPSFTQIKEFRQELAQHLSKIRPKLATQHSIQEAWEVLKKELQQFMQRFGRQRGANASSSMVLGL